MNIFQQLGLPEFHRKLSNKVTQLVKHYDEVVAKHKEGKVFYTQLKRDGVCSLTVVCSGDVKIFSRTGNAFTNTSELVAKIKLLNLPDGVYMGEMWVPKSVCSLEQLSGVVNPNRTKALSHEYSMLPHMLRMSWFDMISLKEFKEGYSPKKFANRHISLTLNFTEALAEINLLVHPDIDVLKCTTAKTEADIDDQLEFLVSGGEEGLVIADPEADWEAGHKGWRKMKKVRGVDYDLLCIGYEEGKGKYKGKIANLIFQWKGEVTIKCMLGKGWTHKMAEELFHDVNRKDTPVGKIFQVYALEESSKGKLRLPKVGEQRFDKAESDV